MAMEHTVVDQNTGPDTGADGYKDRIAAPLCTTHLNFSEDIAGTVAFYGNGSLWRDFQ
jgi:hypothetical protein